MAFLRATATVGVYTMASRVLGFVRDMAIAAYLGAGPVADAFFVAFKFPNFFRRLFAEGAFAAAFVPMFAGTLAKHGRGPARDFAENALAALLAVLFVLVVAAEFAMPWIVRAIAPGFADEPERLALAIEFARLTFPYLLFISLVALMGGILNSLDRFAAVAATPIVLNLCLIGALFALTPMLATPGHALAWGVAIAGVAQFLFLAWACAREDLALRLRCPRLSPETKELLKRMAPVALGSGAAQINLVIDVMLASLLVSGSISWLYYADRIYELPLAVIGIALGTALLPLQSRQIRLGEHDAARATLNRALEAASLFALPATAALIVLAEPIVDALFRRGAFAAADVSATAAALIAYTVGLPAYVAVKILTPNFYARGDTRSPVKIAVFAVIINTVCGASLMGFVGHVGLALATALAAILNASLLARLLLRDGFLVPDARLKARLPRQLGATLAMAGVLVFARWVLEPHLGTGIWRYAALTVLIVSGLASYAMAAWVFGAAKRADLRGISRG
jgi:putative peptidoglycan lipid II flippase